MKLTAIISLLAIVLLGSTATALAQEKKSCSFDSLEHGKRSSHPPKQYFIDLIPRMPSLFFQFLIKVNRSQIATAKYEVIKELGKPESVSFTASGKNRIFGAGNKTMKLVSYDDTSITCEIPGIGNVGGRRVDPDRYFMVLAARKGEFYDKTGSAFPMVIKLAGGVPTIDAFGVYLAKDGRAFGTVPPDVYKNIFERHATTRKPPCVWKSTPGSMKER